MDLAAVRPLAETNTHYSLKSKLREVRIQE